MVRHAESSLRSLRPRRRVIDQLRQADSEIRSGPRNLSQLSDFGRPRASPCNETLYENEITTALLKLKSRNDLAEANMLHLILYPIHPENRHRFRHMYHQPNKRSIFRVLTWTGVR